MKANTLPKMMNMIDFFMLSTQVISTVLFLFKKLKKSIMKIVTNSISSRYFGIKELEDFIVFLPQVI